MVSCSATTRKRNRGHNIAVREFDWFSVHITGVCQPQRRISSVERVDGLGIGFFIDGDWNDENKWTVSENEGS